MAVHSEIFGATTVPWMLPRDTFIYHCDSKGSQWGLRLWVWKADTHLPW